MQLDSEALLVLLPSDAGQHQPMENLLNFSPRLPPR
jgi:hypothetical protein